MTNEPVDKDGGRIRSTFMCGGKYDGHVVDIFKGCVSLYQCSQATADGPTSGKWVCPCSRGHGLAQLPGCEEAQREALRRVLCPLGTPACRCGGLLDALRAPAGSCCAELT